jgi:hypothetical protein
MTTNTEIPDICPYCQNLNKSGSKFCPNCGKRLVPEELSTTPSKQLIIYIISFALAPLGLIWAVKYCRSSDKKTRTVGWIAVFLTVLSIIVTLALMRSIANGVNSQLNTNFEQYHELGI